MKTRFESIFKKFVSEKEIVTTTANAIRRATAPGKSFLPSSQFASYICGAIASSLRQRSGFTMTDLWGEVLRKKDIDSTFMMLLAMVLPLEKGAAETKNFHHEISRWSQILHWAFQKHVPNFELSSKLSEVFLDLGNHTPFAKAYAAMDMDQVCLLRPHLPSFLFSPYEGATPTKHVLDTILVQRRDTSTDPVSAAPSFLIVSAFVYPEGSPMSRATGNLTALSISLPGDKILDHDFVDILKEIELCSEDPLDQKLMEDAIKIALATKLFSSGTSIELEMPDKQGVEKLKALNARRTKSGKQPLDGDHTELMWYKLGYGKEFDRVIVYNAGEWQRKGHFRWQPHGPGMSLYKLIWIEETTCKRHEGVLQTG